MLHTSLAVSTDVLSSVVAFYAVGGIIGKKRRDVKGKSEYPREPSGAGNVSDGIPTARTGGFLPRYIYLAADNSSRTTRRKMTSMGSCW